MENVQGNLIWKIGNTLALARALFLWKKREATDIIYFGLVLKKGEIFLNRLTEITKRDIYELFRDGCTVEDLFHTENVNILIMED